MLSLLLRVKLRVGVWFTVEVRVWVKVGVWGQGKYRVLTA